MKLLLAPLGLATRTLGPGLRTIALAQNAMSRGHSIAICAPADNNMPPLAGVTHYGAPMPSPLGLPLTLGRRLIPVMGQLGILHKMEVRSFEEVLHLTGALRTNFFERDIEHIRSAIRDFKPDIVYSEFRLPALVAAHLEGIPAVASHSYPTQASYAKNPEFSRRVRERLVKWKLPEIDSILNVFEWAEHRFIASSKELEPISGDCIHHVGPLVYFHKFVEHHTDRSNVVGYMGNSQITPKLLVKNVGTALKDSHLPVFLSAKGMTSASHDHIHVADHFDFTKLLPNGLAYINHGGQNSIMMGLIHAVPQIICPGEIFERRYNAESIVKVGAGVRISPEAFRPDILLRLITRFQNDPSYAANAETVGRWLSNLGGAGRVIDILEEHYD
ncbi:glycosyltransferase [Desulfovibrio inopinatus]|uniref:glycosyltransferase n=1 Tax=Desulfovibrio inopinatus TaxID=102109 RepID=UPI00040C4473|nr:nucleotide disphospho-sugar-binding domain-containing protein [Desulfovibrio inopinatus]